MSNAPLNCNDTRYKCGPLTPSACVPFTATLPGYVDPSTFPCDVNIDDVFNTINTTITNILAGLNYTGLNYQTFTPLTPPVDSKSLHQFEINELAALLAQLQALQAQFNALSIGTQTMTIDLQCLTPGSNPCSATPNVYTLFFILTTMLTKICLMASQIATLQAQVAAL